jgi:hypothetical protein
MRNFVLAAALTWTAWAATYNPGESWSALHYCKAAYCPSSTLQGWNCGPSCQFHGRFQLKGVYDNATIQSQGFSGYDPSADQIVVAFRGTSNIVNWISDLDFTKVPYPDADCGCEVHQGFLGEWASLAGDVLPDVSALVQEHPTAQVLVTGHSLGAAVSMLAAMDIFKITRKVSVYNFGEPRVGDSKWAAWAGSRLEQGVQFRVTHKADPVPHLPPESFGFLHCPHELWYDNDGNTTWSNCNDTVSEEDPKCSDSVIPIGIEDHLLYLGICTECSCDSLALKAKYGPKIAAHVSKRMEDNRLKYDRGF